MQIGDIHGRGTRRCFEQNLLVNIVQNGALFSEMKVKDKEIRFGVAVHVQPKRLTPAMLFQSTLPNGETTRIDQSESRSHY